MTPISQLLKVNDSRFIAMNSRFRLNDSGLESVGMQSLAPLLGPLACRHQTRLGRLMLRENAFRRWHFFSVLLPTCGTRGGVPS